MVKLRSGWRSMEKQENSDWTLKWYFSREKEEPSLTYFYVRSGHLWFRKQRKESLSKDDGRQPEASPFPSQHALMILYLYSFASLLWKRRFDWKFSAKPPLKSVKSPLLVDVRRLSSLNITPHPSPIPHRRHTHTNTLLQSTASQVLVPKSPLENACTTRCE